MRSKRKEFERENRMIEKVIVRIGSGRDIVIKSLLFELETSIPIKEGDLSLSEKKEIAKVMRKAWSELEREESSENTSVYNKLREKGEYRCNKCGLELIVPALVDKEGKENITFAHCIDLCPNCRSELEKTDTEQREIAARERLEAEAKALMNKWDKKRRRSNKAKGCSIKIKVI